MAFSSRLKRSQPDELAVHAERDRLVRICVMYGQLDRLYGAALAALPESDHGAKLDAILNEIREVKKLILEL